MSSNDPEDSEGQVPRMSVGAMAKMFETDKPPAPAGSSSGAPRLSASKQRPVSQAYSTSAGGPAWNPGASPLPRPSGTIRPTTPSPSRPGPGQLSGSSSQSSLDQQQDDGDRPSVSRLSRIFDAAGSTSAGQIAAFTNASGSSHSSKPPPPPPPSKPSSLVVPKNTFKAGTSSTGSSSSDQSETNVESISKSSGPANATEEAVQLLSSIKLTDRIAVLGLDDKPPFTPGSGSLSPGPRVPFPGRMSPSTNSSPRPSVTTSTSPLPSSNFAATKIASSDDVQPPQPRKKQAPPPPTRPSSMAIRHQDIKTAAWTRDSNKYVTPLRESLEESEEPRGDEYQDRETESVGSGDPFGTPKDSPPVSQRMLLRQGSGAGVMPPLPFRSPERLTTTYSPPQENGGGEIPTPTMFRNFSSESIVSSVRSDESSLPDGMTKRDKIIKELVETEQRYLNDMKVLKEVYVIPATEERALPAADVKILFSNLDLIIDTSTKFLEVLQIASTEEPQWIGKAFLENIQMIEDSYCEYCKHNEAAMNKLADYASPECPPNIRQFLKTCQVNLQGKTGAWDLSSLVIKPVQRVLKYPLLVKQLLKETPPKHADFESLITASEEIENVAEKINDVKKRKDTVEKYVEGKGKVNVIHGISKKFTRGVQELKQITGTAGEITRDEQYNILVEKLNAMFAKVTLLHKDLALWVRSVKEYLEIQENVSVSFEEVYLVSPGDSVPHTRSKYQFVIVEYRKACQRLASGPWKTAEAEIKNVITPAINTLLSRFREPKLVIAKRDKKLLDFDRAKAIKAKGDPVDKALEESAEAFTSLNAQLLEELPKFLSLVTEYLNILIAHIARIQVTVYEEIRNQIGPVAEMVDEGRGGGGRHGHSAGASGGGSGQNSEIVERWRRTLEREGEDGLNVDGRIMDIEILQRWRMDVWLNDDFSDNTDGSRSFGRSKHYSRSDGGRKTSLDEGRWNNRSAGSSPSLSRHRRDHESASESGWRMTFMDRFRGQSRHDDNNNDDDNTLPYSNHRQPHSRTSVYANNNNNNNNTPIVSLDRSALNDNDTNYNSNNSNGIAGPPPGFEGEWHAGRVVDFMAIVMFPFTPEYGDEMELFFGER
ncbi:hypothetical protein HDU76_012676, partial [Blyttiomyces sp. JEL0837]